MSNKTVSPKFTNAHPLVRMNEYGFYEVDKKPSSEELSIYYAERYYQEEDASPYNLEYSEEELIYINNKIEQKYHFLVERKLVDPKKTYKLLDTGCGEGFALSYFKKLGWDITGLDFSSFGCQSLNPDCMDNFIAGDIYQNLNKLIDSAEQYDVIWLDNVLEHVLDPLELLSKLHTITTPNGVLIIEVPNDFSMVQNYLYSNEMLSEQNWVVMPDHLSYFNKDGLNNLCETAHWHTEGVISDFPIDWFLFNEHSNYYLDRTKGKAAHKARMTLENLLHKNAPEKVIQLFEAIADNGMGRQLIGFYQKR